MLKLTNTLTGTQETFAPADGSMVRMYTCGPTVYNYVHIGNLRTYVWEDVLRRHLLSKGWKLKHVLNITDIDDKIIRNSIAAGVDLKTYTEPFTRAFFEDCDKLRIQRAEVITPATDYIPEMIDLISRLLQSGHAYREDHSVYYRISKFPEYGRLARLDKRELKIGARIEADEYEKEEPRDFVLWKAPKDDREPRWDSPFGPGRPGWHIECSAMATKHLGETLDIHCGAVDNIFPHHENEIAQSEAVTGKQFVRFWIHGEHLLVESEKMAKSKGNFYTLRNLMEMGHRPLAVRYALLSVPYRKPLNFTLDGLHAAKQALDRIADFLFRLTPAKLSPGSNPDVIKDLKEAISHFEAGLDDDLNTAQALAAVFDFIRKANSYLTEDRLLDSDRTEILAWFRIIDDRLAIVPAMEDLVQGDREIDALIEERNQARRNRDFARSDQIRQQLLDRGIVIEDTKEGTRWRRK